jgi:starvation-inducible outer membrane lipoprotein
MKLLIIALALVLSGCATTVPVVAKFPQAPGTLVQEPCVELKKLNDDAKLSDVAKTIVVNYSEYYMCAVKLEAWQRWYLEQKAIYEGLR